MAEACRSAARSASPAAHRVCAVIVTYAPDGGRLRQALQAASSQAADVLLIDNATPATQLAAALPETLPGNVTLVCNERNVGLGSAYNAGARWARARGASHLLLLDQDSVLLPGAVVALLEAHSQLAREQHVAAVGPACVDDRTGQVAPFVRIGYVVNRRLSAAGPAPVPCDFLISSGTLVALDALDTIGAMDETLFIDSVDMEWSLRAKAHGYQLFGVPAARMLHRIGDRVRRLPLRLGDAMVHSPARLYYMMRNRVLLYGRRTTPLAWITQDIPRAMLKFLRLSLFVPPRWRNARAMLLGVADGCRGRSGPLARRL